MKVEITSYGTIWFEDYITHEGWYHPFHDYVFKDDRKDAADFCIKWMVLK